MAQETEKPRTEKPRWAYLCVESTHEGVKAGELLIYKKSVGQQKTEFTFNLKTGQHTGCFTIQRVGPVWTVEGRIQFEEPPLARGVFTEVIHAGIKAFSRSAKPVSKKPKVKATV